MENRNSGTPTEIACRLEATPAPGSPNRVDVDTLRGWALEYLQFNGEELARFPELTGQTHRNLWMRDARLDDALFVVLIFRAEGVEFFCGTGEACAIKTFAENDSPDDPDDVLAMMTTQFSIPEGSIQLPRKTAEKWLGCGW